MRPVARPPLAFRALLRLYPASFRREYGGEMWRVFDERRREAEGVSARLALWAAAAVDALVNAAGAHGEVLRLDLRYALRSLRRAPGFAVTALLVMALGVGANAAAFSLADYVLLRPLPFADAGRLVAVWQSMRESGYSRVEVSPANYRDWKAGANRSLEGMGASAGVSANLVGQGEPQRLEGVAVTHDLFPLLGAQPALGRLFSEDDDREGAQGAVILSWGLFRGAFGGDSSVIGRRVTLDDEPYVVVGVMPEGFAYPSREAQFWRPFRFAAGAFEDRSDTFLRVVGRLRPGATIGDARAELDVVADNVARENPKENAGTRSTVLSMRDEISQRSRALVLALLGASACVLLIACLNLANLLLARALQRRKELALRAALGAGPERLLRQLLTESLLLAFGGGALGLLFAAASLPVLARLVPAELPIAASPSIDLRVLAAAAGATLLSALAFGVLPARRACRGVDSDALREGSRAGVGPRRGRLVRAVVIAEVCASLALLACSGLLLRAMWRLEARDPGFRPQGVLALRTWLPWPKYEKTAERARFYDEVLAKARALPGVSGAAYISLLPMTMGGGGIWPVTISGRPQSPNEPRTVGLRFVTPQLFSALEVPLHAGRDVSETDGPDRPFVAVVSESFARCHWPGEDPLGKRFKVAFAERTVVGVVGNVRVRGLEADSEPQVYLPYKQVPDGSLIAYTPKDLVVRSSGLPGAMLPALREIVRQADPQQPLSDVRTLEEVVAAQTAPRRVQLYVLGTFAGLAFVLAAVGIYGLLSFAVANRSQEIGVRLVLGATPRSIVTMVLREGASLAAVGATLGLAAAYAAGTSLRALLVGVPPADVATFAVALVVVLVMTLVGSAVPAMRAARVDPGVVIRAD